MAPALPECAVPVRVDDVGDVALWTVVRLAVDMLDTSVATEFAIDQGLRPPDGPGPWELVLSVDAAGQPPEGELVWWRPPPDDPPDKWRPGNVRHDRDGNDPHFPAERAS